METPHPGWVTIIQPGGIPPPWPHDTDISDVRIVLLVFVVPHLYLYHGPLLDLGGPPLGEACLDHCPQGDRVVDDQEDGADQFSDPPHDRDLNISHPPMTALQMVGPMPPWYWVLANINQSWILT